ncbi:MAG: carboxypeptidase regulatory-like domain-containing protein [Deltaproteobacteria bacterium]|nr:carboxypeptidase regulatory-like domain-containing protein [Deltaproteobacteria bacterium]
MRSFSATIPTPVSAWRALTCLCLAASLGACGNDDDAGGGEGGSSTSSTTADGSSSSSTTAQADSSSSDGGSVSAESGSSSTTAPADVVIGGVVQDLPLFASIPDAQISVLDMAGFETVSDADGNYTLAPLPPDTEIFVKVEPTAEHFGSILPLQTPTEDVDNQKLAQVSISTVEMQVGILEPMMPAEADLTKGIIVVRVLQNTALGAAIELDPPPPAGTSYSVDAMGAPVLDGNTVESGLLPFVIYFNVEDSSAGDLTITATHPTRTCTVLHPAFPTLGGHVTLIDVDCPE